MTKNAIGRTGQHCIGKHNLFEQTERHKQQSPQELADPQTGRSDQLGEKISSAHDWSGDQLRKKGNRQNEIAQ